MIFVPFAVSMIFAVRVFRISDDVLTAIMASAAPTIMSLAALLKTHETSRLAKESNRKIDVTKDDVRKIHVIVNDRLSQLIKITEEMSFAAGYKAGGEDCLSEKRGESSK